MKHHILALTVLSFILPSCTLFTHHKCTASYYDTEISPSDPGDSDMYLLKISNSGTVTLKTRYGPATAKKGEYFVTKSGEKLWRLKSVDIKTGKVVIEMQLMSF